MLRRTVERMKMQKFALEKESDAGSVDRLHRLTEELANVEEELRSLEARWEAEKQGLNRVGELKKQIDELRGAAERALRDGDLVKAQRDQLRRDPCPGTGAGRGRQGREPAAVDGVGRGRPERHRRGRVQLDRHTGRTAAAGRDREVVGDGVAGSASGWSAS